MERRSGYATEKTARKEEGRGARRPLSTRAAEALRILGAHSGGAEQAKQTKGKAIAVEVSSEESRQRSFAEILMGGKRGNQPVGIIIKEQAGERGPEEGGEWFEVNNRKRSKNTSPEVIKEIPFCQNCRKKGHLKRECKEPARCYNCQGSGHIAKYCRNKLSPHSGDLAAVVP